MLYKWTLMLDVLYSSHKVVRYTTWRSNIPMTKLIASKYFGSARYLKQWLHCITSSLTRHPGPLIFTLLLFDFIKRCLRCADYNIPTLYIGIVCTHINWSSSYDMNVNVNIIWMLLCKFMSIYISFFLLRKLQQHFHNEHILHLVFINFCYSSLPLAHMYQSYQTGQWIQLAGQRLFFLLRY